MAGEPRGNAMPFAEEATDHASVHYEEEVHLDRVSKQISYQE